MANVLENVYDLGDDAFKSLWEISFQNTSTGLTATATGDLADLFTAVTTSGSSIVGAKGAPYRVSDFTIPSSGRSSYDVHYKTQKTTKTGGKIEQENEFEISFRVDQNWDLYKALRDWKNIVGDNNTGAIGADTSTGTTRIRCDSITVKALGDIGSSTVKKTWVFNKVWLRTLGDVELSYESDEPVTVTATFHFLSKTES